MKKLKTCIVGLGNRGNVYAGFSLEEPDQLEIIALVEANDFRLQSAKDKYHVSPENCFHSLEEFFRANIECDFVINATMDELHFSTTISLLNHKYNLLLEKPIVPNKKQLKKIYSIAQKNCCKICVCHVLRYTEFYKTIRAVIDSGKIGTINDLQLAEHVWNVHFVNSYVRGKWRNEKQCGSPFLLAKSCHDMDLMCWLNNSTYPTRVSSFGSRRMFCEEKAPKGSSEYCYLCPHKNKCYYNAEFMEAKIDYFPKYTWKNIDKPFKDITMEEKLEYLKHDIMGKCVYKTDMDIVDRQCINVEFENGSVATFNLVGGSAVPNRTIYIVGSEGEIFGSIADNKVTIKTVNRETCQADTEVIDLNIAHGDGRKVDSHFGGDYGIMENVCAYFRGEKTTSSLTKIEDSINSHLVCYYAEKARKTNRIVKIKRF